MSKKIIVLAEVCLIIPTMLYALYLVINDTFYGYYISILRSDYYHYLFPVIVIATAVIFSAMAAIIIANMKRKKVVDYELSVIICGLLCILGSCIITIALPYLFLVGSLEIMVGTIVFTYLSVLLVLLFVAIKSYKTDTIWYYPILGLITVILSVVGMFLGRMFVLFWAWSQMGY